VVLNATLNTAMIAREEDGNLNTPSAIYSCDSIIVPGKTWELLEKPQAEILLHYSLVNSLQDAKITF
jgi:hypothetical protein